LLVHIIIFNFLAEKKIHIIKLEINIEYEMKKFLIGIESRVKIVNKDITIIS
jgi:hypothetical protein